MTTFLLRPILFGTMVNALFKMKMKPALFYSYFPAPLPSHALKYQFPFAVVINQIYGVSQFFFRYADITLTTYQARTFENLYGIYDAFCEYCVLVFIFPFEFACTICVCNAYISMYEYTAEQLACKTSCK